MTANGIARLLRTKTRPRSVLFQIRELQQIVFDTARDPNTTARDLAQLVRA